MHDDSARGIDDAGTSARDVAGAVWRSGVANAV
jgi:hypothetical protein